MALVPIHLKPGIDTQATVTLNEGGWSESSNIRFFQGLPQKMGGFARFCKATADAGIPRALQAWTALSGVSYLAIACTERLNIFGADAVSDITPDTNPQFLT